MVLPQLERNYRDSSHEICFDWLGHLAPGRSDTLSERLKMLEAAEIVERRFYEKHPPRAEYVLTDKGHDLAPIARAMRIWGTKYK